MVARLSPAQARDAILARIDAAAKAAGRDPSQVALVAVSKEQPEDRIEAVLAAGHTLFGENKVQEAAARWQVRKGANSALRVRLIGPLQTNKVDQAMALFDAIDSLDREKLSAALARAAQKLGRCPEVLVQVNTAEEPQKAGVIPAKADSFIQAAIRDFALPVKGVMCIPPLGEEPAMHFALLSKIAQRNGLSAVSMGMSGDFETAVRFGTTMVRVGSAIFGDRA